MSDEYDDLLDESVPTRADDEPPAPSLDALRETLTAGGGALTSAASLLPEGYDHDEGDFGPDGTYKGFEILHEAEWPRVERHLHIAKRFYVRHNDTVGMVPWPGSKIIWPWDAAWEQDLYREQVTSYLKPDEQKKGKRG